MSDWLEKQDGAFKVQVDALVTYMVANEVVLGFADGDFADLATAKTAFGTKLAASDAAKNAATTAVSDKDASRKTLEDLLRPLVQQIQVNPDVTDATRTAAGIPVRDKVRTSSAPIAVIGLVASLPSPTSAQLVWNSNGNAPGADYLVEKRVNNTGDWQMVDVTRATRLLVQNLTAGQRVDFRVKARRKTAVSDASNVAPVYAG